MQECTASKGTLWSAQVQAYRWPRWEFCITFSNLSMLLLSPSKISRLSVHDMLGLRIVFFMCSCFATREGKDIEALDLESMWSLLLKYPHQHKPQREAFVLTVCTIERKVYYSVIVKLFGFRARVNLSTLVTCTTLPFYHLCASSTIVRCILNNVPWKTLNLYKH